MLAAGSPDCLSPPQLYTLTGREGKKMGGNGRKRGEKEGEKGEKEEKEVGRKMREGSVGG